ncbi:MAG: aromatic-ring-hydroxylating dioxygenase subunit beta [Candidatus Binataceae bacterium]|nr:aromatic-ring-hydroxylating dioxygenase subunit beta [Candidatus Binataceae bacterium]
MALSAKQAEIEQFYYHEAFLLDSGNFHEWLDLFTDDTRYWIPVRQTRDSREESVGKEDSIALVEDDKSFLILRVKRFDTGLAHAEQPPSRTRHFVSNVVITADRGEVCEVRSNVLVFQSRYEKSENFFVGYREDVLRKVGDSWKVASRKVVLDQPVLPRVLSIFF